jgi:hypothetical protein
VACPRLADAALRRFTAGGRDDAGQTVLMWAIGRAGDLVAVQRR